MSHFAENVPESHWARPVLEILQPDDLSALCNKILGFALDSNSRQIALDIGCEDRHARPRKPFRQNLQCYGLARTSGAGNKSVPVRQSQVQILRLDALADKDLTVLQYRLVHDWLRI